MGTKFSTAISKGTDSYATGKAVAQESLEKLGAAKADLAVVYASSKYDYAQVIKGVNEVTGHSLLIGCSSAGEFNESRADKESVVCGLLASDTHKFFAGLGTGLKADPVAAANMAKTNFPETLDGYAHKSAILHVDGLAGNGEEASLATLSELGMDMTLSGGAAGDDLKFKETKVFLNDKVISDALNLCMMFSKKPVAIGVKHGHSPISGPMTITKAKGNVVYEIDGHKAFEVWKAAVKEELSKTGVDVHKLQDPAEIGTLLIQYEAGLETGGDYKIRVPLSTDENGVLNFACTMVEGSVMRVCKSPEEAQIQSARTAAQLAMKAVGNVKLAGAFVFDCVCRSLILGDRFFEGIQAVKSVIGNIPIIGFETYGEIGLVPGQLSGFHNTTTVVLLIPE
ncbi:MAG TPA: FIST N-terminal domain-containing protein [Candidatus Omnitrophota bacterium]|nr:FIST C-terminal domain-containing protein [Candidatus Omnitrophota bacterium]HQO57292.1 FIST N-terminal domain-containing protein [Candidatus Omnitrophota bacterium]HQP11345.1 FIST N-terminal domain-containing protein [Candidatus Omnitrophota bacterium]